MIGWLWRMLVGHFGWCRHVWREQHQITADLVRKPEIRIGYVFVLRCEKCGTLKNHIVGNV